MIRFLKTLIFCRESEGGLVSSLSDADTFLKLNVPPFCTDRFGFFFKYYRNNSRPAAVFFYFVLQALFCVIFYLGYVLSSQTIHSLASHRYHLIFLMISSDPFGFWLMYLQILIFLFLFDICLFLNCIFLLS